MELAPMPEADGVNVQALNMGRIVVDVSGVNFSELINKVSENGYLLRVVDKSDQHATSTPPPLATLTCVRCSITHTTEMDNARLCSLSHQANDDGESERIYSTDSGYLLRTDVWSYSVLWFERLGLLKTFCRPIITPTRRYGISLTHLDVSAECPPGLPTLSWQPGTT